MYTRRRVVRVTTVLLACLCTAALTGPQSPTPASFDVLIAGGRVVDGTGAPWYRADVGIAGDRIAAVGTLRREEARTVIDASGLVVAPGFVDMLGQLMAPRGFFEPETGRVQLRAAPAR